MRLPAPALVLLALAVSCRWGAAREWEEAQRLWAERDAVRAYRAWMALDPATPEG